MLEADGDLGSSIPGQLVLANGRMSAITALGQFPSSFASFASSPADPFAVAVVHGRTARITIADPSSLLLLQEERTRRLEAKLRATELQLHDVRSQLMTEMEKRMQTQNDLVKYMTQAYELQQTALNVRPTPQGSGSVYPRPSCLRGPPSSTATHLPHSEWTRLGYNHVLVAAMFGELSTLEWHSSLGASLSCTSRVGEDAVFLASEFGQLAVLQWLLKKGVRRDGYRNSEGFTALHIAAVNGHAALVEWMLQNGWNAKEHLNNGDTVLHAASRLGENAHVLAAALRACPNLDLETNAEKETALHVAAKCNQLDSARAILKTTTRGLRAKDKFGLTPLLTSVLSGSYEMVQLMLEYGASLRETDADGSSAFIIACFKGNFALAQRLLHMGSHVNESNRDGNSALSIASYKGDMDTVMWLLERGANASLPNHAGNTPLFLAAYGGHLKLVQHLESITSTTENCINPTTTTFRTRSTDLVSSASSSSTLNTDDSYSMSSIEISDNGRANITSRRNKNGSTLLLIASMLGNIPLMDWCLSKGSSLQEEDNMGLTPLIACCMDDNVEAVKFLLSKGSTITQVTHNSFSPLHIAAYFGSCAIITYLVREMRASHTEPNDEGTTPLMIASMNGHMAATQLLIQCGVTVKQRNEAYKVAVQSGFTQIAEYLCRRSYAISCIQTSARTLPTA